MGDAMTQWLEARAKSDPQLRRAARSEEPGERQVTTAIRKHLRDFIAVAVLIVVGAGRDATSSSSTSGCGSRCSRRSRSSSRPSSRPRRRSSPARARRSASPASRSATSRTSQLENGVGVVTFGIDRKFLPIYKDATVLLRPRTGLRTCSSSSTRAPSPRARSRRAARSRREHGPRRQPRRDPRRRSTATPRRTCACCWSAPARASRARDRTSASCSAASGPLNQRPRPPQLEVAQRRQNLADLIHNLNVLTRTSASTRATSPRSSRPRTRALGAIAAQDPNVQRAVSLLPGDALAGDQRRSTKVDGFAAPARPGVQRPAPVRPQPRRDERLGAQARRSRDTPCIKNQIRPFVRAARPDRPAASTRRRSATRRRRPS